jgi:predicted permease
MSRWRRVFRLDAGPRRVERAVDDEIAFHIDMRTRKLVAQGMSPETARATAVEQFGDVHALRDECLAIDYKQERAMKWSERYAAVVQDARYTVRSLRKTPSFTIAVVLLLALGIGANTATFTVIDALMLRELPVAHPEQLVTIGDPAAVGSSWNGSPEFRYVSLPVYLDVRDHNTTLSGLYASGEAGGLDLALPGAASDAVADHPRGRFVTGNYFSVLGIPAFAGRVFAADEDRAPLDDPVVVISHDYWTREFAGDQSVLGKKILINGVTLTIVGVTPPSFRSDVVGRTTDVWIPMMMEPAIKPQRNAIGNREWSWLQMMGRLAPGVPVARARGELTTLVLESIRAHITGRLLTQFNEDLATEPMRVDAGARGFSSERESYAKALVVLMSAVGLVVLVVCANVSNLMLSRATARSREMTVRLTLGAGRARLVQQLLTESALLAIAGGAIGLLLAAWGSRLLLAIASPGDRPIPLDVSPHPTILAFTAATTLLSVMLFGLVPALRASRVDLATSLRAHGRSLMGLHGRIGRVPLVKALVVGQIALSSVLLVGAGLLVQSMRHILNADLGLDRDRVLVVDVASSRLGYSGARLSSLMKDLADRTRQMPGVTAASYSFEGVFSGGYSSGHVNVPGYVAAADSLREVGYDEVGPGYFHSIGARIMRGRDFEPRDLAAGNQMAAINETMARAYFAGVDPIGRTIEMDSDTYTVGAIVRDIEERDVRAKPLRHLYIPIAPPSQAQSFVLLAHVDGDPSRLVAPIRTALAEIDPKLRSEALPLERLVRASVSNDALVAQVTSFFGIVTLVLAGLGLYGVIAYATSQRTNEVGLRLALGAQPSRVAGMVVADALRLAATGIAIGLPSGLLAARLIRGQIVGVGQIDPPSLAVAIGLLSAVALVASYVPARRAARVGPLEALRAD